MLTRKYIKKNIKNNKFILEIDDNDISYIYLILPRLIKVLKNKYEIELIYNAKKIDLNKSFENEITNSKFQEIIEVSRAISLKDKTKRYEYIYDTICNKLDAKIKTNYCEFENGICLKDRLLNNNHINGCCECSGRGKCKYLNNTCTINCMACKLFTCKTIRELNIKPSINDFILAKYFFTRKQKDILELTFFTEKEVVIEKLIKTIKNKKN